MRMLCQQSIIRGKVGLMLLQHVIIRIDRLLGSAKAKLAVSHLA